MQFALELSQLVQAFFQRIHINVVILHRGPPQPGPQLRQPLPRLGHGVGLFRKVLFHSAYAPQQRLKLPQRIQQAHVLGTIEKGLCLFVQLPQTGRFPQARPLLFQPLFLPFFRGHAINFLLAHLQQIPLVGQFRPLFLEFFQGIGFRAQAAHQFVPRFQQVPAGNHAFHKTRLKGRLQQLLLPVLAGMDEQLRPQFAYGLLRAQAVVDIKAAAPAFGQQFTPDDKLLAVKRKKRLHPRLVGAAAHHVRGQSVAKHKAERLEDETFARAGFAGQHIHAGRKFQLHVLNKRKIADMQIFKHASHRLRRGSAISRRLSPSRLYPSTVSRMAMPGYTESHGAISSALLPSSSMFPQLASGG